MEQPSEEKVSSVSVITMQKTIQTSLLHFGNVSFERMRVTEFHKKYTPPAVELFILHICVAASAVHFTG